MITFPGHWQFVVKTLAAFCTLAIFSFLYKENRVYRFAEHVLLGVGMGAGLATTWTEALYPQWWKPMVEGLPHYQLKAMLFTTCPLVGALYYGMYTKKYAWLTRLVIGVGMGMGCTLGIKGGFIGTLPQITDTFRSPVVPHDVRTFSNNPINNIIFVASVLAVISYFFFSLEHNNPVLRSSARLGRIMIMVSLGAFFSNAIMTRMSVFIDRIMFLFTEWLRFKPPGT